MMKSTSHCLFHSCFWASLPVLLASNGFLARPRPLADLLADLGIGGALGQGHRSKRLDTFEEELRPMYESLPKDGSGVLNHATARYALHRFFVQKHGWFVQGLRLDGDSWGATPPTDILKGKISADVHAAVAQYLGDHGFNLHGLTVLAATLEDLVHSEAMDLLYFVYRTYRISVHGALNTYMTDLVTRTFLAYHIIPRFKSMARRNMKPVEFNSLLKDFKGYYPGFDDAALWAIDMHEELKYTDRNVLNPFGKHTEDKNADFAFMARLVERIGEKFGRFQDLECRSMKLALMDIEDRGTGRVPLAKFYKSSMDGKFLFQETPEYLREQGMLDDTDPKHPSVIIPNYLNGQSNCIAASDFYSVCCIDECEGLMAKLEQRIAQPSASTADIIDFATTTASDTVRAPRTLSATLRNRLREIADQHDGSIPLHGRLFAQWMHHAYPHECPFPSVQGVRSAWMSADTFLEQEATYTVAQSELQKHVDDFTVNNTGQETKRSTLPWSTEEELVNVVKPVETASQCRDVFRLLSFLLGSGATAVVLWRTWRLSSAAVAEESGKAGAKSTKCQRTNNAASIKAVKKIRSHLV